MQLSLRGNSSMASLPNPRLRFVHTDPVRHQSARHPMSKRSKPTFITGKQRLLRGAGKTVQYNDIFLGGHGFFQLFGIFQQGFGNREFSRLRQDRRLQTPALAPSYHVHGYLRTIMSQDDNLFRSLDGQGRQPVFQHALAQQRNTGEWRSLLQELNRIAFRGADQQFGHQQAPFPESTAGMVFTRIFRSLQKLWASMYPTSRPTWPEKSISLRPLICQTQVMPGLAARRRRSAGRYIATSRGTGGRGPTRDMSPINTL